ncbi:LysE family translocator [Nafulsella turpanensis]|uniref:LysE family translocator n=1 Tax=Nafulsella turpanensis TaxID=1265690 RepID=UPI00034639C4|nr:LysE family transporter [Nafulsella turpanensis]
MATVDALINGILHGLLLALLIGPVFFALIQTSIEKGFASGAGMAVGIALSDALFVVIASIGVATLTKNTDFQLWLGLAGGIIMLIFGGSSLVRKVQEQQRQVVAVNGKSIGRQLIKGFLLNGINPFVLLFWIGVASMVALNYRYPFELEVVFFAATILTVLLLDFVKAYAANKLRRVLTPLFMNWMNRIVGVVLILFSFRLFFFAFEAIDYRF